MKLEAKQRLVIATKYKNFCDVLRHTKKISVDKNDHSADSVPNIEIELDDGSIVYVSTDTNASKVIKWSYDGDENMPNWSNDK